MSVVIPTCRRPMVLRRAIHSVLGQTYKDFELIVIENGENPQAKGWLDHMQALGHPIRYRHTKRPDASSARNLGVSVAKGDYVAFLDDDDEWLPEKLARQIKAMKEAPQVALVSCKAFIVDESGRIVDQKPTSAGILTLQRLVTEGCVAIGSPSGTLVRRECFHRVGRLDPRYVITSDYEFYMRVARKYQLMVLDEPLYRYHLHDSNMSKDFGSMWQQNIQILKRIRPLEAGGVTAPLIRESLRRYSRWCHDLGVDARDRRCYRRAVSYLRSALSGDPWIGLRVRWGRFSVPWYRILRPYGMLVDCAMRSLWIGA